MDLKGTQAKWLGHGTWLFTTADGKKVLVDPWVQNNPGCPDGDKTLDGVDLMLITHGHFDHIGDAIDIAKQHGPETFAIYETAMWLGGKGVENVNGMNMGGSTEAQGVNFTMVPAMHSCGISDGDQIVYGGQAGGYVMRFPGGLTAYFAGDTTVFGDMKIIGELYKPDICFLPIGDFYTMGPPEAAYAVRLLDAKCVVPMHFATFPVLTGTPDELRKLVGDNVEVADCSPGGTLS